MASSRKSQDAFRPLGLTDCPSGLMAYAVLNTLAAIIKFVSFGKIVPVDEDMKEYWTCKPLPLPFTL